MHLTRFMLFVTVAAVLSPGTAVATDEALLAADGTARMPIVISPHASPDTQAVAAELADYLKRITGAAFTVTAGDGAKGIVLGTIHEFPNPAFAKALEIRDGVDGKEAYAISTGKTRVLLLGGADLGVSHAAYRFLESLGCRWYFPAQEWEVVPAMSRLAVALEEVDRPVILSRRIWYMNFYEPETGNRAIRDAQAWARRNRMASSRGIQCGHAWQSIIADNQAVFAAHPEYRALTGGKRQGEQLCVSNPAVRTLAIDWALDQLRKNPSQDMVSMECSDGDGQCECEECKKPENISDRVFGLANAVAKAVSTEFPGKMVGLYAYSEQGEPLEFSLAAGLIAWYRNRAEAEYRMEDAMGNSVAKARLPLDGQPHPLSIAVPQAGLYWLIVNDQSTAWNVTVAAGKPVSAVLTQDYHPAHLGHMQRMYFYVPQGTRQVQYFWSGGPHRVHGPDGRERKWVTDSGKYITIDVPPGEDGAAWSFGELALGDLYFCNVPSYLAASPDALLLPREVMKRDPSSHR